MSAHILVVEDDPVSAEFLCDVLRRRHSVVCCPSLAEAKRLATSRVFDLLLVDMHLADGSGTDLLTWLRTTARMTRQPACMALSAELDDDLIATLGRLGCVDVLAKPLTVAQLEQAVPAALGATPAPSSPDPPPKHGGGDAAAVWDDDAALRALGGQRDVLARLRGLMRADLPGQRARIVEFHATGEFDALDEELHRLKAACGFCGASTLAAACHALKGRHDAERLRELLAAIDAVTGDNR